MGEALKIIGLLALSAVKFLFSPSASLLAGYSALETILLTTVGGSLGFILFFKFGDILTRAFQKMIKKKAPRKFSRRNRIIVKIKAGYGIFGLALLTPVLLSIPIGAILASIYYVKDKRTIPIFLSSIVIWSFVLTSFHRFFFAL